MDVAAVPQTADATMDSVSVISVTLDKIARKVYNIVELYMSSSLCQRYCYQKKLYISKNNIGLSINKLTF